MPETRFVARRTLRGARFLLGALAAVAAFGLLLLAEKEPLGWGVTVVGAGLAGLVLLQSLRPWWSYAVGPQAIGVHRLLGTVLIPRAQVSAVEKVDGGRIEELLSAFQEAGQAASLAEGIRQRRTLGQIVRFVTVPVVLTRTVQAAALPVRRVAARAHGDFVLVTLTDGTRRALSPRDVAGFVRVWEQSAP